MNVITMIKTVGLEKLALHASVSWGPGRTTGYKSYRVGSAHLLVQHLDCNSGVSAAAYIKPVSSIPLSFGKSYSKPK